MDALPLSDLPCMSAQYLERLRDIEIVTTDELVRQSGEPDQRRMISLLTGIKPHMILRWARQAELAGVAGMDTRSLSLLESLGVDSLGELARCRPEILYQELRSLADHEGVSLDAVAESDVAGWVAEGVRRCTTIHACGTA